MKSLQCSAQRFGEPQGLDYLIGKRTQYYVRRQRDRTLMKGDRVAVLGRGIAVVEQIDGKWIQAVVWSKCELRIARKEIVWDEGNMRWETDANSAFECRHRHFDVRHWGLHLT